MLKADLYTIEAKKSGQINLPSEVFAAKVNPPLLAQAIRVYLSNQRRARAKVKSRGEVSGSRRKIWRQKGTGRARHGDRYAPIFVGGGVTHGPTGLENYQLKMSRKMRRQALFSALTTKFEAQEITFVKNLAQVEPKTKKMALILANLAPKTKKMTLVLPKKMANIIRSARNLTGVKSTPVSLLNPYQVLNGGQLIFMSESLPVLEKTFLAKKPVVKKTK